MMRLWGTQSFGRKLLLLLVLAGGTAALVVCLVLVPNQYLQLRSQAVNHARAKARVIAVHSAAAIAFDDPAAGQETLAALRAAPEVVAAALYPAAGGEPFATYHRPGDAGPPAERGAGEVRFERRRLVVTIPVTDSGRALGSLVLAYDLRMLQEGLAWNVGLAIIAAAVALAAAAAAGMQLRRLLSRPVSELAEKARRIAETGDYAVRARRFSDDELGQFTDVFNQMLEQIQAQASELRQRNQEMEQFVYTVSHDLKSPLVTITGFVGLLKEDVAAGRAAEVEEAADHLSKAAAKMNALIDDLLELSRFGRVANDLQPVDVEALVGEIADDLAPRLEERGARLTVERPLPVAVADRLRLYQVFDNLIGNAIKYGSDQPAPTITVGGWRDGDENRYYVRDNGPGIAPEYHRKVFGLFQRLETRHEGTGVGLAIVARIAEIHGGRAWVESVPGEGATFWIALPIVPTTGTPGASLIPETRSPSK